MAPRAVLAATAMLATLSVASAYDSSYGNSIYSRHPSEDPIDSSIIARFAQKVLARRGLDDDEDLYTRDEPCPPGCLCARHMRARDADADADAEADPLFEHDDILFNYRRSINTREADADAEVDPLFQHDDILFNYKREAEGGDFFDDVEFFDILTRDIDAREAEADAEAEAEAEAEADPLFEHDEILFNYKREALPDGGDSFFNDLEFFDVVARDDTISTREASPFPDPDPYFEHDDTLFNYRRSLDIDPRSAKPSPAADADPLFEHDEILFNYRRSLDPWDELEFTDLLTRSNDPFDDVEFTDLISRDAEDRQNDGSFTPWYQSATAQARKGNYKSPGQVKAEESAQRAGGLFVGSAGSSAGGGYAGTAATAGGVGGNAFNEALDAGSAGASSMDAAAMDAGGLGV